MLDYANGLKLFEVSDFQVVPDVICMVTYALYGLHACPHLWFAQVYRSTGEIGRKLGQAKAQSSFICH